MLCGGADTLLWSLLLRTRLTRKLISSRVAGYCIMLGVVVTTAVILGGVTGALGNLTKSSLR
jgi:hypothetical protein